MRHLGYVTEPQLAALYESARVVLFPSLYEGFGLPAVEAQWAGTPLVCSDLPVLREVASWCIGRIGDAAARSALADAAERETDAEIARLMQFDVMGCDAMRCDRRYSCMS